MFPRQTLPELWLSRRFLEHDPEKWKPVFRADHAKSGGLRNRPRHWRFHDRQIDQRRQHAEEDREPPQRRIRPELLEHDAAKPYSKEAADLMADEGKTIQGRKPAGTEHD